MSLPDDFSSYYKEQIQATYNCVDRIVVNAYFVLGQTPGGFRTWWRRWQGDDQRLSQQRQRELAGDLSRRLRAYCQKNRIPWIDCGPEEVKHARAESLIPQKQNFSGLFAVLVGRAPGPVWQVSRSASGKILDLHRQDPWPHIQHYYFQIMDPQWGHVMIRFCGYPPYGAQVVLNGHEWVERQARAQGVALRKQSNCFVEGSDYPALDSSAARLCGPELGPALRQVCERWLYSCCLCFALPLAEQERTGFHYDYSVWQMEYSRNWLFHRAAMLEDIFQKMIDRTRGSLHLEELETIFGIRGRLRLKRIKQSRRRPEMVKGVACPDYDLTVFRVRWGAITLKIYDKSGRILRVEVMVHNTRQLKCGKRLDKLPELLKKMQHMLVKFLGVVQAAHVSFLDGELFEGWAEPSQRGQRRLAGLDLNKARNRNVVRAVLSLATKPEGFTIWELTQRVRQQTGCGEADYTPRRASYDLAKLRAKSLVARPTAQRRYVCQADQVRPLCAYLVLREQVIKPLLAGARESALKPAPPKLSRQDRHYLILRKQMQKTFEAFGLAA